MKKILVATDGSENAERTLLEAKEYAKCTDGEVTIITVVDTLVTRPYPTVEYHTIRDDEELESVGESVLEKSMEVFEDFDGKVSTKLRRGDPADQIIKEAKENDFDIIFMGSRGLGTFTRTILGSVSSKVLNHSKKNVMVVK